MRKLHENNEALIQLAEVRFLVTLQLSIASAF